MLRLVARPDCRTLARWLAVALAAGAAGCSVSPSRQPCLRDLDCSDGEVCYEDDLCLPADAARQLGGHVGLECGIRDGRQQGCRENETCHSGLCDGPPEFDGADYAVTDSTTSLGVGWRAAHDTTPHELIRYDVFVSRIPGVFAYDRPDASVVGVESALVGGLEPNRRYYVVVRAVDEFGQDDGNTFSVSAVPGCVDYATQIQPLLDTSCTSCHAGVSPPRALVLSSYGTLLAGSMLRQVVVPCRADASLMYMKISQSLPPVGSRMPFGGPYLEDAQIALVRAWIDQGASETCPIETTLCANRTPPSFGGLASTRLIDPTHAELCWGAATDDATPASGLVYEVYEATTPGGEDFTRLPRFTTGAGQTCAVLPGRVPNETNCWVVRARDAAGNRDGNVVEQCMTMPPTACVDYRSMVQPLLDERCVHCHGAIRPFRDQSFESYSSTIARASVILSRCRPDDSLLYQKIALDPPPTGQRMPVDGPPFLSPAQILLVRQWIQEGAREQCTDPNPC